MKGRLACPAGVAVSALANVTNGRAVLARRRPVRSLVDFINLSVEKRVTVATAAETFCSH
jgi:hypothetical protein